ncbi:hypothetical protein BMT54_05635 [Pasteurellaceae bacterium 15-036681]|nr:hypothetical protein BMT54_05635 [Pasteurellaceae bacterium 15-036681]
MHKLEKLGLTAVFLNYPSILNSFFSYLILFQVEYSALSIKKTNLYSLHLQWTKHPTNIGNY